MDSFEAIDYPFMAGCCFILPSSPLSCVSFFAVSMKDGEEQRDLEESQANQIEISFSSEMQELRPLIQALNCSVNWEEASESILLWGFVVSGKGK